MKIDVLGSCVSRDTLEIAKNEGICTVGHYVGLTSQIALTLQMLKGDEKGCLPIEELRSMGKEYKSDSESRSISLTSQKKIFDYLKESSGDYLILDVIDCRLDILNYKGNQYISFNNFLFKNNIDKKLEGASIIHPEDIDEETLNVCINLLCSEILKIYQAEKIIFYQYIPATEFVNKNNFFDKFGNEYRFLELYRNGFMMKIYSKVEEKLKGCHVINVPDYVYADQQQKWGLYPFHYDDVCYKYFLDALKVVIDNQNNEAEQIETLRQKYSFNLKIKRHNIEEKYRIDQLQNMLESVICMNNKLLSEINCEKSNNLKKYLFAGVNEIGEYIKLLSKMKEDLLIIISVKDTPGGRMPAEIEDSIKNDLGFSQFSTALWRSYVGISSFGNVIFDKTGTGCDAVTYEHTDIGSRNGMSVKVLSSSYKSGNKSEIVINGTDYSCNIRGLNIVVYDSMKHLLIDSVAYDSYCYQKFVRKKF